jgi:peptidyl-prolyl cis-trans isomerase C
VIRVTFSSFLLGAALTANGLVSAQTPTPAMTPAASAPAKPVSSGIQAPADPNKIVLAIGDEKLTAAQYDKLVQSFPPQLRAMATGPKRRDFIDKFVMLKVAAQAAQKQGLDKRPEFVLQMDNLLATAEFNELMAGTAISDAEIAKYYNDHKGEFESVKAHHVLIRFKGSPVPLKKDEKDLTEEEALAKAKEVQKRLLAGEDFEKVASEVSDDTTPKGYLKPFARGEMVKEFDEAAFTLPIGKISDPVKTQFGYHIIRVDSRTEKTLAEAKPEIEKKLRPEMANKGMEDLRAKANVTIDEDFFKSAPAAPAAAPVPPTK